ncbi:hypothetical protein SCHPADRAFT_903264 [Schizopora paradoxa]|uniref:Transmembrane protein 135 N-terminal domain-containing protein n=1 Tax=Schizopora paradoxa TaxID=27342 RepID=A0A0H2RRJ1_9AGAM|nr:hypothetical protein SCHPADRAFT_903264 [Schizopora paradoxa]
MTVAIGGGEALRELWRQVDTEEMDEERNVPKKCTGNLGRRLKSDQLSPVCKTFISCSISSLVAILLLTSRRASALPKRADIPFTVPISHSARNTSGRTSATLDLTLMLFVRALDAILQGEFVRRAEAQAGRQRSEGGNSTSYLHNLRVKAASMTDKVDALAFWLASSRIMWCFFYAQERLPRSYVRWIGALANIDQRLAEALRRRRAGTWTYGDSSASSSLLRSLASDLGYPSTWGDSSIIPANGGPNADQVWKSIGVTARAGVGGIPCELVHGDVGGIFGNVGPSCSRNVAIRGLMGFVEAFAIYAPVHFLPILLARPRSLKKLSTFRRTLISVVRSSLFLSTFISSIWATVCMTRTLVIARLFPNISHNFYDGPFGCILLGCLACGGSIWIEQGRRRGEMALYVLPRALRASLRDTWLRGGSLSVKLVERLTFMFSLATILTAARHKPESLRGLSHWTLSFILDGPGADFLKNRRKSTLD